ncbi:MAG: hypothetical protein AAF713_07790 [Pseudomonadota bacterium]
MAALIDHQTKFISSMLGGPASFSNHRLRLSHRNLAIAHSDMDEMIATLRETLAEQGFAPKRRR